MCFPPESVFICVHLWLHSFSVEHAHTVYFSLGSNVGDRAANIARAVEALAAAGLEISRLSSLYQTEPVGFRTQPWFLNCCLEAETHLMPRQLLHIVREIEQRLGRHRSVRNGPRAIDIDILLYGSSRVRMADFDLPHPRMAERRFVLVPLCEIAPTLRHPLLGKTVAELLAGTPDHSRVVRWREPLKTKGLDRLSDCGGH